MEMRFSIQLDFFFLLQYHYFPLDGANFLLALPIFLHNWVTVRMVNECVVNS